MKCASCNCPYVQEGDTCSNCGYTRLAIPTWIKEAYYANTQNIFSFRGRSLRIVSIGSINDIFEGYHYRDYVIVVDASVKKPTLPEIPASVSDVRYALSAILSCERIFAADLHELNPRCIL